MTIMIDNPKLETSKAIQLAVETKIRGARVSVRGSRGHFEIDVETPVFEGMSTLQRQRTVYGAIEHLMSGENAPIHTVDRLITSAPLPSKQDRKESQMTVGGGSNGVESDARSAKLVTITAEAQAELKRLIREEKKGDLGLRLGIKGGGCSGLTYSLEFSERREGDTVIEYDGFSLFLDKKSTVYLSGVTLDYRSGLSGRGFVFRNPHATNTCGCGESFSL